MNAIINPRAIRTLASRVVYSHPNVWQDVRRLVNLELATFPAGVIDAETEDDELGYAYESRVRETDALYC